MKWFLVVVLVWSGVVSARLVADLNGDCRVDLLDLAILASEWMLEESEDCMANKYIQCSDGYFLVPATPALNPGAGNFTLAFWFKTSSVSAGNYIYQAQMTVAGIPSFLEVRTVDDGMLYVSAGDMLGNTMTEIVSAAAVNDGIWRNLIITKSGAQISLYLNNTLQGQQNLAGEFNFDDGFVCNDDFAIDTIVFEKQAWDAAGRTGFYGGGRDLVLQDSSLAADGWYSNCNDGTGTVVSGRKVISGSGSAHNGSMGDTARWCGGGAAAGVMGMALGVNP